MTGLVNVCRICGVPVDDAKSMTCTRNECYEEYMRRREIANVKMRTLRALEHSKRVPMSSIQKSVIRATALFLLERDIPSYISSREIDEGICIIDPDVATLNPVFRRSQITKTAPRFAYSYNSRSSHGKSILRADDDRSVVEEILTSIVNAPECVLNGTGWV